MCDQLFSKISLSLVLAALALLTDQSVQADDASATSRFTGLALECVHQEYPNKISHVLSGDQDVAPPRELTPVFYGCVLTGIHRYTGIGY